MASVLITGANKGIGLELVKLYAGASDRVYACCRNPAEATALQQLAAVRDIVVCEVRVSDGDSVAALARTLSGQSIDILINNAGTSGPQQGQQTAYVMDFDGWAETFAVNTMAPVRVMQALLANLKAGTNPKIMTISSQMGALSLDMPFSYAYCTSKTAVNKFMRLAATELSKDGISVGLIHPGWVKTDMGGSTADISPEDSARGIVNVIAQLTLENTGAFWKWNGEPHGW